MAENLYLSGGRLFTDEGEVDLDDLGFGALVSGDPTEVDLDTVDAVTTLTLTDEVARNAMRFASGQYYFSHYTSVTAQTLADGTLVLCPVWLSAGTIDRIGVDVAVAAAASAIRVGIYTDDLGLPANLIAEANNGIGTYPLDSTTTGVKDAAISAVIPVNGRYWLAGVCQGSAAVQIQAPGNIGNNPIPIPLGTAALGGTTAYFSRIKASVASALPGTITGLNGNPQGTRFRWHFRYA